MSWENDPALEHPITHRMQPLFDDMSGPHSFSGLTIFGYWADIEEFFVGLAEDDHDVALEKPMVHSQLLHFLFEAKSWFDVFFESMKSFLMTL
jgi:hypothetical protein